jgi:hypothetical protein
MTKKFVHKIASPKSSRRTLKPHKTAKPAKVTKSDLRAKKSGKQTGKPSTKAGKL